jgi:hypothetical protein
MLNNSPAVRNIVKSPITVFYKGSGPVKAEVANAKKWDRKGLLKLVDISRPGFSASGYGVMANVSGESIYIRDAAGKVLTSVDALYAINDAVGLGNYFKLARLPGMAKHSFR